MVIIEERYDGEKAEPEEAERDHNAAARTGDSGDEAAPGTYALLTRIKIGRTTLER